MDFLDRLITLALEEDLGASGDVTTSALVPKEASGRADLVAKEDLVLSGLDAFARVFRHVDPDVQVIRLVDDGEQVRAPRVVAELRGRLRSLLIGERTALNVIQRACGIA